MVFFCYNHVSINIYYNALKFPAENFTCTCISMKVWVKLYCPFRTTFNEQRSEVSKLCLFLLMQNNKGESREGGVSCGNTLKNFRLLKAYGMLMEGEVCQ